MHINLTKKKKGVVDSLFGRTSIKWRPSRQNYENIHHRYTLKRTKKINN